LYKVIAVSTILREMKLGFNETKIRIEVFQFVKIQILEILYPENKTEYSSETVVRIY
jgi:hypothetical protein